MTIKRTHVAYDSQGIRYEYELDPECVIKIDGKIVTESQDPRTKTKRLS